MYSHCRNVVHFRDINARDKTLHYRSSTTCIMIQVNTVLPVMLVAGIAFTPAESLPSVKCGIRGQRFNINSSDISITTVEVTGADLNETCGAGLECYAEAMRLGGYRWDMQYLRTEMQYGFEVDVWLCRSIKRCDFLPINASDDWALGGEGGAANPCSNGPTQAPTPPTQAPTSYPTPPPNTWAPTMPECFNQGYKYDVLDSDPRVHTSLVPGSDVCVHGDAALECYGRAQALFSDRFDITILPVVGSFYNCRVILNCTMDRIADQGFISDITPGCTAAPTPPIAPPPPPAVLCSSQGTKYDVPDSDPSVSLLSIVDASSACGQSYSAASSCQLSAFNAGSKFWDMVELPGYTPPAYKCRLLSGCNYGVENDIDWYSGTAHPCTNAPTTASPTHPLPPPPPPPGH
eukprot:m.160435 g.160435  ORF g.160435 m.160435 type:complete len:405 (+) comp18024_c0_seq1:425-1639(+)